MSDGEANKELIRSFFDQAINGRDVAVLDEVFAPGVVTGSALPGHGSNLDALKAIFDEFLAAFPDYRIEIEEQVAEGPRVATRYTASGTHRGELLGVAPTGKVFHLSGIDLDHIHEGRIVEHHSQGSIAELMLGLGFEPPR